MSTLTIVAMAVVYSGGSLAYPDDPQEGLMIYIAVLALFAGIAAKWLMLTVRKDPRFQGNLRGISSASTALFALAVLLFIGSSFVIIPAGHIGVQVLFGRVQPNALPEGMRFINPFVDIQQMTVRTETYTMSATSNE